MSHDFRVVLIANDDHPIPGWVRDRFAAAHIEYKYHQCYTRTDLEEQAADADLLWLQSGRQGLIVEEHMDIFKNLNLHFPDELSRFGMQFALNP